MQLSETKIFSNLGKLQHYVILLWSSLNQVCQGLRAPAISQFLSNIVATFQNLHSWVSDFSVHLRHLGLGPALWRDRQLLWSFEKFNWLLNFSDRLEILFLTEFHHSYHKLHVFAPALLHATAVNSQDLFTSAFETLRITIITLLVKLFELAPPQESTAC